jgi:ABC-type lipopolysaccharide export system ATPase subunit
MKIQIQNLGVLKQAEFSLGDLTILCGGNNTGKTYATYALFGFLYTWHAVLSVDIQDDKIKRLLDDGVLIIDLQEYAKQAGQILAAGCHEYAKLLPKLFAAPADRFQETIFQLLLDTEHISFAGRLERKMRAGNSEVFSVIKSKDSEELTVTLLAEKEQTEIPGDLIKDIISDTLKEIIFASLFPKPFIVSSERTGAVIFTDELDIKKFIRENRMTSTELRLKDDWDYPLPVQKNVAFIRQIKSVSKKRSFIAEKHPELLADFADIIGGEYHISQHRALCFLPRGKRIELSMDESSGAVRSLLDIGFYLRCLAQPGDLLMVDEPELSLHPENQRRMARLFARLVNLGIKVFITTHSDYIIKELNTLIMLNHDKPHLKRIAENEGYRPEELISPDKIKVYIAETMKPAAEAINQTLTPADIDPELGIEARSFDTTIETMNRIQEEIVWRDSDD